MPCSPVATQGSGVESGGALPGLRSFGPKTAIFRPRQPRNLFNMAKPRKMNGIARNRLGFLMSNSPLAASAICPSGTRKLALNGPKSVQVGPEPRMSRSSGYVAQKFTGGERPPKSHALGRLNALAAEWAPQRQSAALVSRGPGIRMRRSSGIWQSFVPLSYDVRGTPSRRGSRIPLHPLVAVYKFQVYIPPSSDGIWVIRTG